MDNYTESVRNRKDLAVTESIHGRMKECTFTPKVNITPQRRNLSQFISDQVKYDSRLKTKLSKMTEEANDKISSTCKPKPAINEFSKRMIKKRDSIDQKSIHERLYSIRGPPATTKAQKEEPTTAIAMSAKAKRLSKKESELILRLYKDAKAREENLRSQRKEIEKKPKLNYSYVNDPHVVSKFMKEFNDCIASFGIEINDKTDDCELDFTTMKQIMSRMGFTHTGAVAEAEKNQYEKMILDIFTSLDGENRNMVKIGGLKKVIAGIFNISLELGDSEESNRLHNEYKLLYLLRKSHVERPSTQQTGMVM